MRILYVGATLALAVAGPAAAQHEHGAGGASEIKALTADQMHGYMTGEGMGMALAAELNHYPGPKHVLEFADSLGVNATQRAEIEAIRQAMLDRALELGSQIVSRERELDTLFATGRAATADVGRLTERIGVLNGQLRGAHLTAHIATRALLTPAQIETYDRLRGHADGAVR